MFYVGMYIIIVLFKIETLKPSIKHLLCNTIVIRVWWSRWSPREWNI